MALHSLAMIFNKLIKTIIISILGLVSISICLINLNNWIQSPSLFIEFEKVGEGYIKFYWDTGNGFNESETNIIHLGNVNKQILKASLPEHIKMIRIDPEINQSEIKIKGIYYGYFQGMGSVPFSIEQLHVGQQLEIQNVSMENSWSISIIPNATDPFFYLDFNESIHRELFNKRIYIRIFPLVVILIVTISLMIFTKLKGKPHNRTDHE